MANTIFIEALLAQDIPIDTGLKLSGKSVKTYYLTGKGIRNQVQSSILTSGNLLVSIPSLAVGKYSLIVTEGRNTIFVATIEAINKIESTVTKEFIEQTLTGEITSHTHDGRTVELISKEYIELTLTGEILTHTHNQQITALVTKSYIEGILTGCITSHIHPATTFTYFV